MAPATTSWADGNAQQQVVHPETSLNRPTYARSAGPQLARSACALCFSFVCTVQSDVEQSISTDMGLRCCSNAVVHPFTPVVGPSAWYADQYRNNSECVYNLSPEDLAELDAAVAAVSQSGKQIQASPSLTCPHDGGQVFVCHC